MELSTVYTLLKKSVAIRKDIGVQDIMIVLDLAIYAKAVEVRWQIAVTGKRFKFSGLEDILIESDVAGVIEGKQYNRDVRAHKIVSEACLGLKWESFDNWLTLREDPVAKDMNLVEAVKHIRSQPCDATLDDLMGMRCFE